MVELEKKARRADVFVNKMETKWKCVWKTEDMSRKRVSFLSFVSLQPSSVVKRTTSTSVCSEWVVLGEDWASC